MTTPDELAESFARHCEAVFTPAGLAEIRRRNALPEYRDTGCCATHDLYDANMIMLAAFEEVVGRPMIMDGGDSPAEQADHDLWNAAWEIATSKYLTALPPKEST